MVERPTFGRRLRQLRIERGLTQGALRAATDPEVRGGEYYGPAGRAQFTGHPVRVESSVRSHDAATRRRLWSESERLTGVAYPIGEPAARPA